MTRRLGKIISLIAEPDNLRLAAWKASKNKRNKKEVLQYLNNLDEEINLLRAGLLAETLQLGNYHRFTIRDPKIRIISAASFKERVLHHAIMNICHERFDRYLIDQSFASRKNLGTAAAWKYARKQQKRFKWFLKLDVRKYFESINHEILMHQLSRLFKDKLLLRLFEKILFEGRVVFGTGLPIGNLTSQYWANHYLGACDYFILQSLKSPAYARYMDDMVLWHDDKEKLKQISIQIQLFCNHKLKLELKQPIIQKTLKGLPFLGYVFYPDKIRLNKRSSFRFKRKMKELYKSLEQGKYSQKDFQRHALPVIDFAARANTKKYRFKFLSKFETDIG